jgi:hypothetical protein
MSSINLTLRKLYRLSLRFWNYLSACQSESAESPEDLLELDLEALGFKRLHISRVLDFFNDIRPSCDYSQGDWS